MYWRATNPCLLRDWRDWVCYKCRIYSIQPPSWATLWAGERACWNNFEECKGALKLWELPCQEFPQPEVPGHAPCCHFCHLQVLSILLVPPWGRGIRCWMLCTEVLGGVTVAHTHAQFLPGCIPNATGGFTTSHIVLPSLSPPQFSWALVTGANPKVVFHLVIPDGLFWLVTTVQTSLVHQGFPNTQYLLFLLRDFWASDSHL